MCFYPLQNLFACEDGQDTDTPYAARYVGSMVSATWMRYLYQLMIELGGFHRNYGYVSGTVTMTYIDVPLFWITQSISNTRIDVYEYMLVQQGHVPCVDM